MGRTERLLKLANLLRGRRKLRFDQLLERLDVSRATLKRDLKYLREQLGTPIGSHDLFIAAHARSRGLTLVTHNIREFARVPDLNVQDWLAA